jgi:hypothetical protein
MEEEVGPELSAWRKANQARMDHADAFYNETMIPRTKYECVPCPDMIQELTLRIGLPLLSLSQRQSGRMPQLCSPSQKSKPATLPMRSSSATSPRLRATNLKLSASSCKMSSSVPFLPQCPPVHPATQLPHLTWRLWFRVPIFLCATCL